MKHLFSILIALICLTGLTASAQFTNPDWYVLEKGATVSIIKPGVNDITLFLAQSGNKPVDKAAVDAMNNNIKFSAGTVVLIYAKEKDYYIAQDMEGRNLVIKGNVTKVTRGQGCTVGYLKNNITSGSTTMKRASFVWVKEHKQGSAEALLQGPDNTSIPVQMSQLYDINATTLEMVPASAAKAVE